MTAVAAPPVRPPRSADALRATLNGPADSQQTVAKAYAARHGIAQDSALAGRIAREFGLETLARTLVVPAGSRTPINGTDGAQ
jgi:hypothetical protein